jgi:N-methylhydantoinase A
MAPIAGRYYAGLDSKLPNIIIADTGGTTYDVSLVRRGRIPKTRETWIGQPYRGHMTGFSSIEIKSIGAGGGSIAHVDEGRVLHVGPESAGAVPGPVSYGTGGTEPTLTDACVVLDYLDPDYFLGGAMQLDVKAARNAIDAKVAKPLGLSTLQAAASVVGVATENMVQAISEITVNQGIDPAEAVLVGGGGGAGLNSVFIARRLGCPQLVIPETGAALSASGATMSDLSSEYRAMFFTTSADWNEKAANAVLRDLEAHCKAFQKGPGKDARSHSIEFTVEARYASQVWELDVPLRKARFSGKADLARLIADFHAAHQEIFAVRDEKSIVEFVGWTATVSCGVGNKRTGRLKHTAEEDVVVGRRKAYFEGHGSVNTAIHSLHSLKVGKTQKGPAIIESPFTTIVVDPGAKFMLAPSGSVVITP